MLKITDKGFKYTPSFNTDLKAKFRKLIREQDAERKAAAERDKANEDEAANKVVPVPRRVAK